MVANRDVFVFLVVLFAFSVTPSMLKATPPSVELGTTPAETGATKIVAAIVSDDNRLTDLLTQEPVILPPFNERIAVPGGKVFWAPMRDEVDSLGYRHIRYQQRLMFSGALSEFLPEPYSSDGVPFSGGSLKLHYNAEGVLYFVSGAYFDNPQAPVDLSIQTPLAAISRVWWALENTSGFEMADLHALDAGITEELLEFTKLKLASSGDGQTFSLIWEAPALLAGGDSLMAALNGRTGDLIHFWDPNPHQSPGWGMGPCLPQSSNGTSATANPQNPALGDRFGLAATPSTATSGYTHEAFWPETSGAEVQIFGYRGTNADACSSYPGKQRYEIVPLPTKGGHPSYDDNDPGVISDQQIVGDAVWKTQLTMKFFDDLGWDGWNNQGTSAKIVIKATCCQYGQCNGNALFVHVPEDFGPTNSVVICPKKDNVPEEDPLHQDYSSSASLDVVAHEWGHGVVFTNAWEYSTDTNKQLHEGWADIIGYGAEWHKENPGNGSTPETAEWHFDEDSGRITRQPNLDDFDPAHPSDPHPFSYHASDPCPDLPGHYCGNRLAVAFWLAADGTTDDGTVQHKNPVCRRNPNDRPQGIDCNLTVAPLGHWSATRIFFRALTVYVGATDDWDSFAEIVKHSAHDLYAKPWDCADDLQDTVQDAFTAIGYPGPTPSHHYCHICGCPN
jgi:hypothetical protein